MPPRPAGSKRKVPTPRVAIERTTLPNGLRVVLAPDRAAPAVAIVMAYDVGFRSEPEGRTGFAHLFEHLMFEGSASVAKLQHAALVQGNGGVMNGQTKPDQTVYFEQLPPNALELGLFLEADRMRSVLLSQEALDNQIAVVQEEIRVNVLNRPFGGFPWIHLPPVMFDTHQNAHDGYGSFADLESATVEAASDFFARYYAPRNAVLAVAGDLDVGETTALIERHFGDIPAGTVPPATSFAEPLLPADRRVRHDDALAPFPALALGHRVPDPIADHDAYLAVMVAIDVLAGGPASRLHDRLVRRDRVASHVGGYLGAFGDPLDQRDPVIGQLLAYHPTATADVVIAAIDDEVERLVDDLPGAELDRVITSNQAGLLRRLEDPLGRSLLLATLEITRGDPDLVHRLTGDIGRLAPAAIQTAAATWLRPGHRAILEVARPAAEAAA